MEAYTNPKNVKTRVQQYPDANFRKKLNAKQRHISDGRFQQQSHNLTSQFLDLYICSNSFFPFINIPTCHTRRSKTLTDIFHNNINENKVSCNVTPDISDHSAKFLITLTLAKINIRRKKTLIRNFKSFCHEKFKNNLRQADWTDTLNLQMSNVNHSFAKCLKKIS